VAEAGETDSVSGDADTPEWVATTVVSDEQVDDEPEYHVIENVEVPPVQEADSVIDLPLSMTGAEGVMEPAVRAALTVKVAALEVTVAPLVSVTWSSNDHVPVVERAPVEVVGSPVVVQAVVKELPRLL